MRRERSMLTEMFSFRRHPHGLDPPRTIKAAYSWTLGYHHSALSTAPNQSYKFDKMQTSLKPQTIKSVTTLVMDHFAYIASTTKPVDKNKILCIVKNGDSRNAADRILKGYNPDVLTVKNDTGDNKVGKQVEREFCPEAVDDDRMIRLNGTTEQYALRVDKARFKVFSDAMGEIFYMFPHLDLTKKEDVEKLIEAWNKAVEHADTLTSNEKEDMQKQAENMEKKGKK